MKTTEKKRNRGSVDSNKTRVLVNQNQKYLHQALVDDLLIPLLNTSKILEGNPPRNSKQKTVTLLDKYNYLQKKIRDARSEVNSGLSRWNQKYEKTIQEHLARQQIVAAEEKLNNLKKSSSGSQLKPGNSSGKFTKPAKPQKIKLSKDLLRALEQFEDFFIR